MEPIISYLITFFVGVATGVGGQYFADKYTDKRRKSESFSNIKNIYVKLKSDLPELIREMEDDLRNDNNKYLREFVIMSKGMRTSLGKCLAYYTDDHKDLKSQVTILENYDFVTDVTETNLPRYRMSEEFVALLRDEI